jgi:hypothetical protein
MDQAFKMLEGFCAQGNLDELKRYNPLVLEMRCKRRLDLSCYNGCIIKAMQAERMDIVDFFLRSGLFNRKDMPIHDAIQAKSIPVLQLFLDYGWDINQPLNDVTPLYMASVT